MAIATQPLFERMVRAFAAEASHQGFIEDFVAALNNAVDKYSIVIDRDTKYTHITDTDETLNIPAEREYIIMHGVVYWLIMLGHKHGDLSLSEAQESWTVALADARLSRDQDAAVSATDDEVIAQLDD